MATFRFGVIGASIYAGTNGDPIGRAVATLQSWGHTAAATNRAVGGTNSNNWLPGGSYLPGAKAAFTAAGATFVMLGGDLATNDGKDALNLSVAQHLANVTLIVNDLIAAGFKVVLNRTVFLPSPNSGEWTGDTSTKFRDYFAAEATLMDGVNVFMGDCGAGFAYSRVNSGTAYASDGLHLNAAGNLVLGDYLASAITYQLGFVLRRVTLAPADGTLRGGFVPLPGRVTGLAAGTVTATGVPLSWVAPATGGLVTGYLVQYRMSGTSAWITSTTVTTLSSMVTGLSASTSYDVRVTATNAVGSGTASAVLTVTTAATLSRSLPVVAAAGASVWFDASNPARVFSDTLLATSQTVNGGMVKGLSDALGSGKSLVQANSSTAPNLATAKVNGRNMLTFTSASAQVMASGAGQSVSGPFREGQAFTARFVFMVSNINAGPQGIICAAPDGSLASYNPGTQLFLDVGGNMACNFHTTGGDAKATIGGLGSNTIIHLVVRSSGANFSVRSTVGGPDTAVNFPATNAASLPTLVVGTLPGLPSWAFNGWLGEVAFWPGMATSAETDALLADAVSWWGA